jgi:hypothetical protein
MESGLHGGVFAIGPGVVLDELVRGAASGPRDWLADLMQGFNRAMRIDPLQALPRE